MIEVNNILGLIKVGDQYRMRHNNGIYKYRKYQTRLEKGGEDR